MEKPDRIYLHPDIGNREFIRPWLRRAFNHESVEYIRTEAVLEWVKLAYGKVSMNPFDCVEAFEELLEKINPTL